MYQYDVFDLFMDWRCSITARDSQHAISIAKHKGILAPAVRRIQK